MTSVLVVDGANVIGSRPDGWWKDRGGAARRLHERLMVADLPHDEIVLVLEGAAKGGVKAGRDGHVRVVHAPRDGDSEIERVTSAAVESGAQVTVVTADRFLQSRVQGIGAMAMSPSWLLGQIG
ncbi:NYN domain-containing protein [Nocardioides sp. InS609-2]|uniref:NYN domain-containing protein n=1 Tax=Nocardioides sp. InS609-2 TaxID=2760705 RepID=UPI0020C11A0B|nr:NYN domain-containing protein [Nocardioides sp. InS609-2]